MKIKEIKKQAKQIMDKFQRALDRAGIKDETVLVERDEDRREEDEREGRDEDFRKIMLKNAPKTEQGYIVAERKKWEE